LAAGCAVLGLATPIVLRVLQPIVASGMAHGVPLTAAWTVPLSALFVILVLTFAAGLIAMSGSVARRPARRYITWECGFGDLSPRAQVSGVSFVQPIARMFSVVFRYAEGIRVEGMDRRLFPEEVTAITSTESVLEARVYDPAARWFGRVADRVQKLQEGSIHRYLLTMFLTLLVLLVIGGYLK
ncbi:MAG: hypothetical protein ACLQVD_08375, partial [Capsulimonadaceae bacterium]